MPEANPYTAPLAPISGGGTGERELFTDLDFKTLKKLRNHSHTIRTLGILWGIGAAAYLVLGLMMLTSGRPGETAVSGAIFFAVAALVGTGTYASFARPAWGRVLGIILNGIGLLGFPIGTLIGALGLIAYIGGEKLFGDKKYLHADLNREFKHRKQNKIT